jgi:hypothetical protein
MNHLATDGAMIVLNLLDPAARLIFADHPAFQAILTTRRASGPGGLA